MFFTKKDAPAPKLSSMGQKAIYGGLLVVGLLVLGPTIIFLTSIITSLLTAVVAGLGIFGIFIMLPVLNRYLKIVAMKLITKSAVDNPIETLQIEYQTKEDAFQKAKAALTQIVGQRNSLAEKLGDFKRKHPDADCVTEEQTVQKYSLLVDRLTERLKSTAQNLAEFKKNIQTQADRYEIAKSTGQLAKMLKEADGSNDPMSEFLTNTAIESVRKNLNTSLAEIDSILLDEDVSTPKQIKQAMPPMIDVTPASQSVRV